MKEKIREHILFTIKMLNPVGVVSLFFGIIAIIMGKFSLGIFLILYSSLLYEINWKFDNLKDIINKEDKK